MEINTLRAIVTAVSFLVFVGILVWVWQHRKTQDFKDAANLPFIDDESL